MTVPLFLAKRYDYGWTESEWPLWRKFLPCLYERVGAGDSFERWWGFSNSMELSCIQRMAYWSGGSGLYADVQPRSWDSGLQGCFSCGCDNKAIQEDAIFISEE